jgi:glycosyltransferase involved in cell wall biosynthesis
MLDDWSMAHRPAKKKLYLKLFGRRFLRHAAAVHLTAQAEYDQASKWFTNRHHTVLPYLFDLAPYAHLPGPDLAHQAFPSLSASEPNVLFLSRVHPKKGPELLIRSMAAFVRRHHRGHLQIAGPVEPAYRTRLLTLAAGQGLTDRIHFLGMVTGQLKLSLLQAADMFVLPTSQENFGIVLLEALACGTPGITTHGVDIWQELAEAGTRIVERTPQALAAAMSDLATADGQRVALARHGRDWVFATHARSRTAPQYETLYAQAAGLTLPDLAQPEPVPTPLAA